MSGSGTGTVATPATPIEEPLTIAEVMAHCQIDQSNMELAPSAVTVALASPAVAGNVTAGAHRYRVTFTTADGETEGGTVSDSVTVANAAVNGKVEITGIPIGGILVTGRKIYRTAAGGTVYMLLATISNNTDTSYTDNIADASLGAGVPTENTTSDPLLSVYIAGMRAKAESRLRRKLITQTDYFYLDRFPSGEILIPPAQSVTSVTYTNSSGAATVLPSTDYVVDTKGELCRITPAYGLAWPQNRDGSNSITIVFVAGYGARADVPQSIKLWMLMHIRSIYDNRGAFPGGNLQQVSYLPYIDALLAAETVHGRTTCER